MRASACSSWARRTAASSSRPACLQWAQRIVLASPRPAKLSINSHSLAGVRARYVLPFEDEILGGGVFILNASIDRIERMPATRSACTACASDDGTEICRRRGRGHRRDRLHVPAAGPPDARRRGLRPQRAAGNDQLLGERHACPGIYFAGTIGQGVQRHEEVRPAGQLGRRPRRALQRADDGLPRGRDAFRRGRCRVPRVQAQRARRPAADRGDARARAVEPEVVPGARVLARCRSRASSTGHRPARPVRRRGGPAGVAIAVETDDTGDIHPAVYVREPGKPAVETLLTSQPLHDFRTADNRAHLSEILRGATAGAVR